MCKECGASYEACRTPTPNGLFRWRDVACSRECAMAYMTRVMDAREQASGVMAQESVQAVQEAVTATQEEFVLEETEPTEEEALDEDELCW